MSESVRRVREHFSTIQITMVSIVVALALQEWLDRLPAVDALWQPSWVAVRVWCQALVSFAIILKMWTGFVLAAATTQRVPRAIDLIGPMGILVFVDAQIACIDADHVLRWLYILGVGQVAAAAFIAGQRIRFEAKPDSDAGAARAFSSLPDPATVETWIGAGSLVAALAHQTIGFGEPGLLAVSAVILLVQIASAAGPIMAWRILHHREAALLREEPGDDAQPS